MKTPLPGRGGIRNGRAYQRRGDRFGDLTINLKRVFKYDGVYRPLRTGFGGAEGVFKLRFLES